VLERDSGGGQAKDVTYQVIPNQPTAKKLLNIKRNVAAAIPVSVLLTEFVPARTAIDIAWPAAPNNMSGRRPILSIVKMAMIEARKYSVPLHAARSLLMNGDSPMLVSKIVAA